MKGVGREVFSLTLDRLQDLPTPCVSCIFWELDPALAAGSIADGDPGLDKESWLSSVLLEWGSVGRIGYVDGAPAGYITYAPPYLVPRAAAFPTAPVSADAMILMTARVIPEFAGQGLGRVLIQGAAKDVMRRGVRAVEAFGYRRGPRLAQRGLPDPGQVPDGGGVQDRARAPHLPPAASRPAHGPDLARGHGGRRGAPVGLGQVSEPEPGSTRVRCRGRDQFVPARLTRWTLVASRSELAGHPGAGRRWRWCRPHRGTSVEER